MRKKSDDSTWGDGFFFNDIISQGDDECLPLTLALLVPF